MSNKEDKIIELLEEILTVLKTLETQGIPPVEVTPVVIVKSPQSTEDENKIKQDVEKANYWHMLKTNEGVDEEAEAQQPDPTFMGQIVRRIAEAPEGVAVTAEDASKCTTGNCKCTAKSCGNCESSEGCSCGD